MKRMVAFTESSSNQSYVEPSPYAWLRTRAPVPTTYAPACDPLYPFQEILENRTSRARGMTDNCAEVPGRKCLICIEIWQVELESCVWRVSFHKYAYVHGDPIQGIDPTGMFLGSLGAVGIGLQMHLTTLVQGGLIALTLNTVGKVGAELRNLGIEALAAGDLDLGFQLYEIGGRVFQAAADTIETVNNGIELFGAAVSLVQIGKSLGGFLKAGGIRNLGLGLARLASKNADSAMQIVRGKLGGIVASAEHVGAIKNMVEAIQETRGGLRMNVKLEVLPRGAVFHSDGTQAAALYAANILPDGTHKGVLKIPHDATHYEIQHELAHMYNHIEQGRQYFRLTPAAREMDVYDRLRSSPYWSTFTKDERIDASRQVGFGS